MQRDGATDSNGDTLYDRNKRGEGGLYYADEGRTLAKVAG
jgi:hypothetical protein